MPARYEVVKDGTGLPIGAHIEDDGVHEGFTISIYLANGAIETQAGAELAEDIESMMTSYRLKEGRRITPEIVRAWKHAGLIRPIPPRAEGDGGVLALDHARLARVGGMRGAPPQLPAS